MDIYIFYFVFPISFSPTPHRVEEFLAFVPIVVLLKAHLAIKNNLVFVTLTASEHLLLHTAFGTIYVVVTFTLVRALWEGTLCADTPFYSISDFGVFFPCES